MGQAKLGEGNYFKIARPILVVPRDMVVPLCDGGQSRQRMGYKHIKVILLFHILHDDVQREIDGEFGDDSDYTLSEKRDVRTGVEDEIELYDVYLEGTKLSSSSTPDSEYE